MSSPAPANACADLRLANSRSMDFILSNKSEIRSGSSSTRLPLTISVSEFKRTCSLARKLKASNPTSASTRRTPAPIEDSPSNFTRPSSAEDFTWVPPQSSRAQSPTLTTRTVSPYFSPKSAMAPMAFACGCVISCAVTRRFSIRSELTRCSTSRITDIGRLPEDGKSKRKRPGAFSEPAWVAVSPRASRKAL